MQQSQHKPLGLWMLTTLVAGNMIGSGIFLLPSTLAKFGSITLFSWCFTAIGAFCLAIVFSKMSLLVPKSGGPYAYAAAGFGEFVGFQTAFSYWIAVWVGNAGIAVAMIGYLIVFFPILSNAMAGTLVAIGTVWLLTWVNIIGLRTAGIMQIVTTILKLIPVLLIAFLGWWYFHPEYLAQGFNVTHDSNFSTLSGAVPLTLWAFIGIESATVPAGSVENPRRNIPLATLLGTLIAAVAYIASSTAIMGMIPIDKLAMSTSPFAAAANIIFGRWGNWFIAAGAVISCFGCLNGWVLLQGQIPMAAADDGLFPKLFSKRNKTDVPAYGIFFTSVCMTILLLMTSDPDLNTEFETIISLAVVASLVAYFYTAIAEIVVSRREGKNSKKHILISIIAILAAIYSFWAICGSGVTMIAYELLLLLASLPFYAWMCYQKDKQRKQTLC